MKWRRFIWRRELLLNSGQIMRLSRLKSRRFKFLYGWLIVGVRFYLVDARGEGPLPSASKGIFRITKCLLMWRRPLRHFDWLLHNDIERDQVAKNDRKEVDRQRRDVRCGGVFEAR
jgi:hypothetical protein